MNMAGFLRSSNIIQFSSPSQISYWVNTQYTFAQRDKINSYCVAMYYACINSQDQVSSRAFSIQRLGQLSSLPPLPPLPPDPDRPYNRTQSPNAQVHVHIALQSNVYPSQTMVCIICLILMRYLKQCRYSEWSS